MFAIGILVNILYICNMLTSSQYLDIITQGLDTLDLPAEPRGLYAPIRYALDAGGKRIRPMLTLATADALGLNPEEALPQALSLEIFHNCTLLHDDIMDGAEVRRGHPTVHCRWNQNTAILSGDAMLTYATLLSTRGLDEAKVLPVLNLFSKTAMEVYEGQQLDMDFEERRKVSVEEYIEMIRLKTSVLLGCATKMGAICAGANVNTADAFYRYGVNLGLAFQIKDDMLDTFGDPMLFGKAIGGDILQEKKTWLLITALNEDPSVAQLLGPAAHPDEKIERVRDAYRRLNLDTRAQQLVREYLDKAIDALPKNALSPAGIDFFTELANKSAVREN